MMKTITKSKPEQPHTSNLKVVADSHMPLSRKATNKISQLISKVSDRTIDQIKSELTRIDFSHYSNQQYAKVVTELPHLLSLLFRKEYGISSIDTSDDLDIVIRTLAELVVNGNKLGTATITIGLGATTYLPSIRIASYLIPILKTLTNLSENDMLLPKVRVFKASHTGIYANLLDKDLTLKTSLLTLEFLSEFVAKFYPHFKNLFIFEQDLDYKRYGIYDDIKNIEKLLTLHLTKNECIASVAKMGFKHGGASGEKNALFYAAAHPIFNKSIIPTRNKNVTTKSASESCDIVIDYGGRPQVIFNKISSKIKGLVNHENFQLTPTINIITTCGKIPVYYYAKNGDYHLGEELKNFDLKNIDPITLQDYELLFSEIPQLDYLHFVGHFKEKNLTTYINQ